MRGWAGLFGGILGWYGAHELGVFFSDYNCHHRWILPIAQIVPLLVVIFCGRVSYISIKEKKQQANTSSALFAPLVGTGGAVIFSIVIFLQAVATLIYSGCER
jgi:hypothetical protein